MNDKSDLVNIHTLYLGLFQMTRVLHFYRLMVITKPLLFYLIYFAHFVAFKSYAHNDSWTEIEYGEFIGFDRLGMVRFIIFSFLWAGIDHLSRSR